MGKFFKFIALAMCFVMLSACFLSVLKLRDKDTDTTDPADEIIEGVYYTVDGTYYQDEELPGIADGTYVYFVEDGITRFARVFTEKQGQLGDLDFVYSSSAVPEYTEGYCCKLKLDNGDYEIFNSFDLVRIEPYYCFGAGADFYELSEFRVIAVFLELENCEDPASVLAKFDGNTEFCSSAKIMDPSVPEGPSDPGVDPDSSEGPSEEVETPSEPSAPEGPSDPQIDPSVPEGPGAE